MGKEVIIFRNDKGIIYFIDKTIPFEEEIEPDFMFDSEKTENLFNILLDYQNKGYKITFTN